MATTCLHTIPWLHSIIICIMTFYPAQVQSGSIHAALALSAWPCARHVCAYTWLEHPCWLKCDGYTYIHTYIHKNANWLHCMIISLVLRRFNNSILTQWSQSGWCLALLFLPSLPSLPLSLTLFLLFPSPHPWYLCVQSLCNGWKIQLSAGL